MGYPDNFSAKAFSRAHDGPSPEAERYANEKVTRLMAQLQAIANTLIWTQAEIDSLGPPEQYPNEEYTYHEVLTTLGKMIPNTSKPARDDAYDAAILEWEDMQ